MDLNKNINSYVEGALMAALAAVIALFGFYIPPFQFITVFIWLVPIVVVSVRRDFNIGVLSLITACIILMILAPPWTAFLFIIQFAGLGLVFCYYFSKKEKFYKIIMVGTIVVAISTLITIILSFLILGMSLTDFSTTFEETADSVIEIYERTGMIKVLQEQGLSMKEIREEILAMATTMGRLMPALMVTYGMTVAFISYFIIRKTLQKLNLPVTELPSFHHWQIPWYFVWGIILGLGLLLIADYIDWSIGKTIGMNIIYLYLPILFVQGLSVVVFFYKKWNINVLLKVLILVIIVVNVPLALMLLLILGLFDPLFNYRRLGQGEKKA